MAPGSQSSDMRLFMTNAEQGHYSVTGESWRLGPPNRMTVEHNDLTIENSTNLLSSSWATHVNFAPPKLAQPSLVDNSEDWGSGNLAPGSVPALFQSKLRLSSPGPLSANVGFENTEDKGQQFDLLSELEWRTIGNLLPDDEELFSSFINDIDASGNVVGVNEELELFSSGGGLELENDAQDLVGSGNDSLRLLEAMPGGSTVQNGSTNAAGEHPFGEHPSRTLFVRNINSSVEDTELRALFEQYGDIRTLYTACKHRGFVMISYYDIRAARSAMRALQNKSLRRRKLDIHFSIPKDNPSDKDVNQGTLVVFNLDASVSNDDLRQIFGIYGEVKEIRETPHKRHHKFIEFYDVRSAEAALRALNRSDIAGKRIKLEPSRPGGARRSLMQQLTHDLEQEESSPLHEQVSSLLPKSAPVSLGIMGSHIAHNGPSEPLGMSLGMHQSPITGSNILQEAPNHGMEPLQYSQASTVLSALKAQMIAEHHQRMDSVQSNNPSLFELSGGSQAALPPFMHRTGSLPPIHGLLCNSLNSVYEKPQRMLPVSQVISSHGSNGHAEHPSYVDSRTTAHLLAGAVCNQQSHIGSAPVTSLPLLNRYHGYLKESLDTSSMLMRNASLGTLGLGISGTPTHLFGSHSYTSHSFTGPVDLMGNSCIDHGAYANLLLMSRSRGSLSTGAGHDVLPSPAFQWSGDRSRNRKSENPVSQNDKKHYELDIDRIMRGEDMRTTLMIKNIPNKYTSKMLLAAIDEFHKGTYDFIYLPIDFKNKCNVGYAFINMTEPSRIVPFYQAFNGKRWEKFNSEKVASLAYARIQGKPALIAHFQNSSLMNEDKRCRPILFHSGGPNVGDQEPFPVGSNARTRSKSRGSNGVSQGSPISIINTRD